MLHYSTFIKNNMPLSTIIEEDVWDLLDFSNVTVRRRKPWEPIKMTDTIRRNTAYLLEPIAVRPVFKAIPIKQFVFKVKR
jgi:hypothetical protein